MGAGVMSCYENALAGGGWSGGGWSGGGWSELVVIPGHFPVS